MNRTIRDVLLFGAGFAAGAYVMHTVFRTKYQEYADAQIDDVRDHYRKKEADLDAMIEEKAQMLCTFCLLLCPQRMEIERNCLYPTL